MHCPVCKVELRIADRQGVELDYCPQCRGVWLDRGELDKLLERERALKDSYNTQISDPGYYREEPRYNERRYDDDDFEDSSYRKPYSGEYPHKRKRKSFLGEIFDFD
ncbi:MAG TPA: zf-TFIIB domain-containing protein [Chloroflexia bacterium]|nr:zf-TFIIB domain-containing protein [Chloroflexia bacterium]